MTMDMQKIFFLLNQNLYFTCPVLSGNMKTWVNVAPFVKSENEIGIILQAPNYDMKEWQKTGRVIYTGPDKKTGLTDYAQLVNDYGAFGTHNKSEHWVNRACFNVCSIIANEIGAELINKLPLD